LFFGEHCNTNQIVLCLVIGCAEPLPAIRGGGDEEQTNSPREEAAPQKLGYFLDIITQLSRSLFKARGII